MKRHITLLIIVVSILPSIGTANSFTSVCERTHQIRETLELETEKKCHEITQADLNRVYTLYLNGTGIEKLEAKDFSGLSELRWLDLGFNKVEEIPLGIFKDLGNLERLEMSNNQIRNLPKGTFRNLNKLKSLHLSNNLLSELHGDLLVGLENLTEIWLHSNPITAFPKGLFDPLISVRSILIGSPTLERIADRAFALNRQLLLLAVLDAPLTETSPTAFEGVMHAVDGLPPTFNVDSSLGHWEEF